MNDEQNERKGRLVESEVKVIEHEPGEFGHWNWEPADDIPDWDDEVSEEEESV